MQKTEVRAVLKTVRIAPRKTRLIIDLIRGKEVSEAKAILANQTQRAARVIEKVLNSAIANAVNNHELEEDKLYVKACYVDEAKAILANQPQRAARVVEKVLNSAIANAVNNHEMDEEKLYVKTCYVD